MLNNYLYDFLSHHLHYYEFTGWSTAIEVVDYAFIAHIICVVFLIKKSKIRDMVFTRKKLIQQNDEQIFAGRLAKNDLKTYICKRIDESGHNTFILNKDKDFNP